MDLRPAGAAGGGSEAGGPAEENREVTKRRTKRSLRVYGLKVLQSPHRDIRRLKRENAPSLHGYKQWGAGWLLIDYIRRCGMRPNSRVMDLGCGWGLVGIYCARYFGARVTAVDKDPAVFPFLRLHARINGVTVKTLQSGFEKLRRRELAQVDVLVGSDICFWDSMVNSLRLLILRALRCGVRAVVLSDPGRETFEELARYFTKRGAGEVIDWTAERPHTTRGRILRIEAPG